MDICHHCDNPSCYELTHLLLGTRADNMQDMAQKKRYVPHQSFKTHCPAGHEYNEENTYVFKKHSGKEERICKTCQRERARERYRKKKNLDPAKFRV